MKNFWLFLAFLMACLLAPPASLEASILSNLLTFDGPEHFTSPPFKGGGEDKIDDDSRSLFIDVDGNEEFSVGDVIWGVLTISDVQASGVPVDQELPPNRIVFVFSAKIAEEGDVAGSWELAPVADDQSDYDLRNLLDSSVLNGLSDETIVTVFSAVDTATNNPIDWSPSEVKTELTTTKGWSWELTADMKDGTDDFFVYKEDVPGQLTGVDRGGLTITSSAFSAVWLDVDVLDFNGVTHYNNLVLYPASVTYEPTNGWTFTDHSTFFVNAVPEPVSLITWAGLAGFGAAFAARRRRRS